MFGRKRWSPPSNSHSRSTKAPRLPFLAFRPRPSVHDRANLDRSKGRLNPTTQARLRQHASHSTRSQNSVRDRGRRTVEASWAAGSTAARWDAA